MSALATAFQLTSENNWQSKYDITIYQLGWRLGGKLWNGRNPQRHDRDEEHGYHILFGFYKNVFQLMTRCYQELARKPGTPVSEFFAATRKDEQEHPERYAMHRNSTLYMATHFQGIPYSIPVTLPENNFPPDADKVFTLWTGLLTLAKWCKRLDTGFNKFNPVHLFPLLIRFFLHGLWWLLKDRVETQWISYFIWIICDLMGTTVIGLIEDHVYTTGFNSLNEINFYEWLIRHQTVPEGTLITIASMLVEFAYIILFAYQDGDTTSSPSPTKPLYGKANVETGTLLRFLLRMILDYKGAFTWIFNVSAGDAIVAPLYEVLHRRGVKFQFFSNIKELIPSADQNSIQYITVERQIDIVNQEYSPLIQVNGLSTWPSEPLYDQIDPQQAKQLKTDHVDLESWWTAWKGTDYQLEMGVDFDTIVLGISIAALRPICKQFTKPQWIDMLSKIETVRSFAVQTWLTRDLKGMGWLHTPVLSNTGERPVDLRADASHVVAYENWPSELPIKNRTYFGGLMENDSDEPLPPDPAYPLTQNTRVKTMAIDFLNHGAQIYWPNAVENGAFRWDYLVDLDHPDQVGPERFDYQFWKANIDPTCRYVQALSGTGKYRLRADSSGYANLVLTGDWTSTELNCGSLEATVMSGLLAAQTLSKLGK
jgi:uncharacterized protein with NAD-binding domain and iron-sulfur cluster